MLRKCNLTTFNNKSNYFFIFMTFPTTKNFTQSEKLPFRWTKWLCNWKSLYVNWCQLLSYTLRDSSPLHWFQSNSSQKALKLWFSVQESVSMKDIPNLFHNFNNVTNSSIVLMSMSYNFYQKIFSSFINSIPSNSSDTSVTINLSQLLISKRDWPYFLLIKKPKIQSTNTLCQIL